MAADGSFPLQADFAYLLQRRLCQTMMLSTLPIFSLHNIYKLTELKHLLFYSSLPEYKLYIQYAYPIFFYMPLVAIAVVSVLIGVVICSRKFGGRSNESKNDKEKQAIIQLALIVSSYMLGYLPFTSMT